MKKQLSVCIFFCVWCVMAIQSGWGQGYVLKKSFGRMLFHSLQHIVVDTQGAIYVLQSGELIKLDATGKVVFKVGSYGTGAGQFGSSDGLALDKQGIIYVMDDGNKCIHKLDPTGKFLAKIPFSSLGNGSFEMLRGIALDSQGNMYVMNLTAFSGYNVVKFDPTGKFLLKFGSRGGEDGQFDNMSAIMIDMQDNVYIADSFTKRVQKFDATGKFLLKLGSSGDGDGQFAYCTSLAADTQGNVYVGDYSKNRIQKFDATGKFLLKAGAYGTTDGKFYNLRGVAVDVQGNMYAIDEGKRVQKFDATGTFLTKFGSYTQADGEFKTPTNIAIDHQNNIYVLDTNNDRVQKFDSEGRFLSKFTSWFVSPEGMVVDNQGNIYVVDSYDDDVKKYDPTGKLLLEVGTEGSADGQLDRPSGVALDSQGNIYVVEKDNNRVQKFDAQGKFLLKFGSKGKGNGEFNFPVGIVVDNQGNSYVIDLANGNDRVQKFDAQGNFLLAFGSEYFTYPTSIALDSQGNVYVGDQRVIYKFTSSGKYLTKIDGGAEGVAVDSKGLVYATYSGAVHLFERLTYIPTVRFTAPLDNSTYANPTSIHLTALSETDGSIKSLEFYNGATKIGDGALINGLFRFTWNGPFTLGTYTLTAKATNDLNVTTTSTPVTIRINAAPVVQLTAPLANAVFTSPTSIDLSATATHVTDVITAVEFYQGTTKLGAGTLNNGVYTFTWTGPFTAGSSYTITAKATDSQNGSTTSTPVTIRINAAPTVRLTPILASPNTILLRATASDTDGSIKNVEFYNGTTKIGDGVLSNGTYSYTWTDSFVVGSSYTLTAKATDDQNGTTTSTPVTIRINAFPVVQLTAPLANAVFISPTSIDLSATASDADGSITSVEFYHGTTKLGAGTLTNGVYTFTWTGSFTVGNSYTIRAKATDSQFFSVFSTAVTIRINAAPMVQITAPVDNMVYTNPSSIELKALATDANDPIAKVEFFNGTTKLGTGTFRNLEYVFTWTGPFTAGSSYILTAKATDDMGSETTSTPVTIHINAVPVVAITSHQNDQLLISPKTIELTATASDADGSVKNVAFFEGTTKLGDATLANGLYSFSWTAPTQLGDYTITAQVTDDKGASTTSSPVTLRIRDAITSTEAELRAKGIRVVPTADLHGYTITSEKPLSAVRVLDRLGREVYQIHPATPTLEVPTGRWAAGVYLLVMHLRSGELLIKKVVR